MELERYTLHEINLTKLFFWFFSLSVRTVFFETLLPISCFTFDGIIIDRVLLSDDRLTRGLSVTEFLGRF